jgi:hypothetical protein
MPWRHAIVALFLTLWSGIGRAQEAARIDPLRLPGAVLLCRSTPTGPTDSAAFVFEYVDGNGSEGQRTSFAAFDSVGEPLYMMVSAPGQGARGERVTRAVVVRFIPNGLGERVVLPDAPTSQAPPVGGADSVTRAKASTELLTDAEVAHARVLAEWFWEHRCTSSDASQ